MTTSAPRVLLVDDEPHLLDGLRRQLRTEFCVETAVGGPEGLARLRAAEPFAVIVSDFRMPEMSGGEFLAAARALAPDSTRMLLTGDTDLQGAVDVVNRGQIFQFMLKPIAREVLVSALHAGVAQHRSVSAEKVLLEQTLHGSVKALTEILSLASPVAFARSTRLHRLAAMVVEAAGETMSWDTDLALMLSQIGAITLPTELLERLEQGMDLSAPEKAAVERLPQLAEQILSGLPRLESVREAIRWQSEPYSGVSADSAPRGVDLPLGSRLLRLVCDYDALEIAGRAPGPALRALGDRAGVYDATLLTALATAVAAMTTCEVLRLDVHQLQCGMVLADDVYTSSGVKLIPRGHDLSPGLLERIRNFSTMSPGVRVPITVFGPKRVGPRAEAVAP